MKNKIKNIKTQILKKEDFGPNYKKLTFKSGELVHNMEPGQFVNLRVSQSSDPLLRRPMSIHEIDRERERGEFSILYQVVGKGTKVLDQLKVGDPVEILAPLGLEFPQPEGESGKIALIAGGIGIAPLLALAQELKAKGHQSVLYFGVRTESDLAILNSFKELGVETYWTSEDGSSGVKGYVTALLKENFDKYQHKIAYACGPMAMLKSVKEELEAFQDLDLWFSLEAHMACGIGVCLGCTVELKAPDGSSRLALLCQEGPVIRAKEVVFLE